MARDASLVGALFVATTALGCASGGLRPGSPGVPGASDTSGCVVTMLVGTAVGDGNTLQAIVAGSVSNFNDQSVAHFAADSDDVVIDGAFGTSKIGTVRDDRAITTYRVANPIESSPIENASVSFDLKDWGTYEAKGAKCSNRELGLGAVHLVTLVLDDARRLHERRR